mgnify:CR=1 FL=1
MARKAAAPFKAGADATGVGAATVAIAAARRRRNNGRIALIQTSQAPSNVTNTYDASSSQRVA